MKLRHLLATSTCLLAFCTKSYAGLTDSLSFSIEDSRNLRSSFVTPPLVGDQDPALRKKEIWILSLDGGGIRGIIPAQILSYIEDGLAKELKDRLCHKIEDILGKSLSPGEKETTFSVYLAKVFDLMAGTSTGGIITLGLNMPNPENPSYPLYHAKKLVSLYQSEGDKVFSPSTKKTFLGSLFSHKFGEKGLDALLRDYFNDTSLKESITNVVIPAYELRQERIYTFDSQKARESQRDNFKMRNVARATSAAPTYLPAAEFESEAQEKYLFADGGIVVNNPSMAAFLRAQALFPQAEIVHMLSLGTGYSKEDNLHALKKGGIVKWVPVISSVIMNGTSDFTHYMLTQRQGSLPDGVFDYMRIQPLLTKNRKGLDDIDEENLHYLSALTKREIQEKEALFSSLIKKLAVAYETSVSSLMTETREKLSKSYNPSSHSLSFQGKDLQSVLVVGDMVFSLNLGLLSTLQELNLEATHITEEGMTLFSQTFPHLKTLNVKENKLGPRGALAVSRLSRLTALNIADNPLEGVGALAKALTQLETLDVSKTGSGDLDLSIIVSSLPGLTSFYGNDNPHFSKEVKGLLHDKTQLRNLSLAHSLQSPQAIDAFLESLQDNKTIQTLDISHNNMTTQHVAKLLEGFGSHPTLTVLSLYYNAIDSSGGEVLGNWLKANSVLRVLNLRNNNLGNEGVKQIARALSVNSSLEELDLSRNNIKEEGLIVLLDSLMENKGLKTFVIERKIDKSRISEQVAPRLYELKHKRPSLEICY